jgi:hypothetical protein
MPIFLESNMPIKKAIINSQNIHSKLKVNVQYDLKLLKILTPKRIAAFT